MSAHFQPAMHGPGAAAFGNALLARPPMRVVRSDLLPHVPLGPRWLPGWREPRVACWASITLEEGVVVQVLATHLGLHRRERLAQVRALLGPDWLGDPRKSGLHTVLRVLTEKLSVSLARPPSSEEEQPLA